MNTSTATAPAPTDKQINFIESLYRRIHTSPTAADAAIHDFTTNALPTLTRRQASALVGSLLDHAQELDTARKRDTKVKGFDADTVPVGRYALTEDDLTTYYRVDKPTSGRWDGWVFVNAITADGEDVAPVRGADRGRVLALISRNPTAAFVAYGRETGTCGICSRTLTNAESRARGIGPICAKRF